MTGKRIDQIVNGVYDASSFEAVWNTKALPSGTYILELSAGGEKVSRKVEIVK
jgi:hypothetical protein